MTATLLPAAERIRRPWRNGGGATRDVLISPPSASLDGFDWRLSLAEVTEPGPFSAFPGVDRTLCVLEGTIELQIEGAAGSQRLAPQTPALSFPGDVAVFGRPVGGPVTDLNLMVRRAAFVGSVRNHPAGVAPLARSEACAVVLVATAPLTVRVGPATHLLQRFDALRFDPGAQADGPVWISEPAIVATVHRRGEARDRTDVAPADQTGQGS